MKTEQCMELDPTRNNTIQATETAIIEKLMNIRCTVLTARAWTLGVKNDCKSMSVKLRYWIVKLI